MLSQKLIDELNEQIKFEFYSSHLYLAAAAYTYELDLDGFANFFIVQAEEEKFHAMKFFNFISEMGARVKMNAFDTPKMEYKDLVDLFEYTSAHEQLVTDRIYKLMDIATEEREHATISFLKWFIDEQVEEMATFKAMTQRITRAKDDANVIFGMDDELATRVFRPPTGA